MASDEAAAAAAGAGSGYVVIPECEADLPCNICNSELFTFDNDILRCKACKVVVHQDCYGVLEPPKQSFWYCMKCLPHNTSRASKLRCRYCPMKDGAIRMTTQDGWAHIICALYIDGLSFPQPKARDKIVVRNAPPAGQANCCICADLRSSDTNVGIAVPCDVPDCGKRMHVTCAHNKGLVVLGPRTVDHPPCAGRIVCPSHKSTLSGSDKAAQKRRQSTKVARPAPPREPVSAATYVAATAAASTGSGRGTPTAAEPTEMFTCNDCGKRFISKHSLTGHRRVHFLPSQQHQQALHYAYQQQQQQPAVLQQQVAAAAASAPSPPVDRKAKRTHSAEEELMHVDKLVETKRRKEAQVQARRLLPKTIGCTVAADAADSGRNSPRSVGGESDLVASAPLTPTQPRKRTSIRSQIGVKPVWVAPHTALQSVVFSDHDMVPFLSLQSVQLASILLRNMRPMDLAQSSILLARATALQNATEQTIDEVKQLQEELNKYSSELSSMAVAEANTTASAQLSTVALTVLNAAMPRSELPLNPLETEAALRHVCAALDRAATGTDPCAIIVESLKDFRRSSSVVEA